jgi:phage terminase large subunit
VTEQAADLATLCRDDPVGFSEVILGRPELTPDQQRICRAVAAGKTMIVPTGNSIGKTFVLAGIILWWLYTRPDSLVICTAPSQTLLGSVLFKEIRRALQSSQIKLPGTVTDSPRASPQTLQLDSTGWDVLGIATRGVERLSGQHSPDLLCVVDEASGVEDEIWEALDSQNPAKLVACGNPLRAEGRFRALSLRAERERNDPSIPDAERVHEIRIPSTASPDIHLPRSPRGLADKGFLDQATRMYGKDSLWWRTHVLAQFPEISSDVLIPEAWLDWCTRPEHRRIGPGDPRAGKVRMGVDLGEGVGRDRTVILVRDDQGILEVQSSTTVGLPEAAHLVHQLSTKWHVGHDSIAYDVGGMLGRSFRNHLLRHSIRDAKPYAGEGTPKERQSFTNLRTGGMATIRDRMGHCLHGFFTMKRSQEPAAVRHAG